MMQFQRDIVILIKAICLYRIMFIIVEKRERERSNIFSFFKQWYILKKFHIKSIKVKLQKLK